MTKISFLNEREHLYFSSSPTFCLSHNSALRCYFNVICISNLYQYPISKKHKNELIEINSQIHNYNLQSRSKAIPVELTPTAWLEWLFYLPLKFPHIRAKGWQRRRHICIRIFSISLQIVVLCGIILERIVLIWLDWERTPGMYCVKSHLIQLVVVSCSKISLFPVFVSNAIVVCWN